MGKDFWHYFGGRRSSRRATDATVVDHHRHHRPSFSGCMTTLFHFFDFHSPHFTHFVFNKNHLPHDHSPNLRLKASPHGVEAPRNSLELDEAPISCLRNKEENLQIQMGLQIKTRNGSTKSKASEQQLPNGTIDHNIALESPSANTPSLLARLMGLDILPQTSSSSYRPEPKPGRNVSGTRSLPESPRVSSARLSDVDHHHRRRLSLQITLDKENIKIHEEIKQEDHQERRRKVRLVDITNNNTKLKLSKREVGFNPKRKVEKSCYNKKLKKMVADESSSKLRNQEVITPKTKKKPISIPMPRPKSKAAKPREDREEAFDCPTRCNKLLNNPNYSTKFSVKKDHSPPTAKIPHEQPCSYPRSKKKPPAGELNAVRRTATRIGGAAELNYIKKILTTHGISMNSPISSPNWFSPSHPLDPSIFHHLETTAASAANATVEDPTRHRCNRKLLFHLVNEVLAEIVKSWHVRSGEMEGWELAEEVRKRIEEFPRAKCQVLEDIDGLIEKDLGQKWKFIRFWRMGEMEGIVKMVEVHILESLVSETAHTIYQMNNT